MVNFRYYDCKLAVSGPRPLLSQFEALIPSDGYVYNFTFDAFAPTPEQFTNCDTNECTIAKYKWRQEHWGTGSDATEGQNVNLGKNSISVFFGTIGNYPDTLVRRLSWRFPGLNLLLSYESEGERGFMLFQKGKCQSSKFSQGNP